MGKQKSLTDYVPASVAIAGIFKTFWAGVGKKLLQEQFDYDPYTLRLIRKVAEAAFHVGIEVGKAIEPGQPEQKEREGE